MTTIQENMTFFDSYEKAVNVARVNSQNDNWVYIPVRYESGKGAIKVLDETGKFLGYL